MAAKSSRTARCRTTAVAAALGVVGLGFAPAQAASAPGDGQVTVRVVRDHNFNGNYDPAIDTGQQGIRLRLVDEAGNVMTGTSRADGTFVFSPAGSALTTGRYRLEGIIPPSMNYLRPARYDGNLESMVVFVDVSGGKNVTVNMGVENPADYSQADPPLATPTQYQAGATAADPSRQALVRWPWSRRGDSTSPRPTAIANYGQIGTTYGLAWKRSSKLLFVGASAKRHTAYGPAGPGGIYVLRPGGTPNVFATVPNAGTTAHGDPLRDPGFFDVPGKESLGDLDISEDERTLYAINLANKSLVSFDVTNAAPGQAPASPKATVAIPNPGCSNAGDWRAYGLKFHDGALYIGGVCSGESTQSRADLKAFVLRHVPGGGFSTVISHALTFQRGFPQVGTPNSNFWEPWITRWDLNRFHRFRLNNTMMSYTQPMLSDIEFDRDGSMILGFRDRFGDQMGYGSGSVDPADTTLYSGEVGGDVIRVCRTGTTYTWDSEGSCPNHHDGTNGGGQATAVKEYYPGDHAEPRGLPAHQETGVGSLAFAPRFNHVASSVFDPQNEGWTNGVGFFHNKTGAMDSTPGNGYHVSGQPAATRLARQRGDSFGKANGIGDLEILADPAPIQIGNRVWYDQDADGIQDPDELPIPGVKVTLRCPNMADRTTTTDGNGEYFFNNVPANVTCTLIFDPSSADTSRLPGAPPPSSLQVTRREVGTNRAIDSNIDNNRQASVNTGPPGNNNQTVDAGFTVISIGDFVWYDSNANGVQDPGEPPISGVTVTLKDATGKVIRTTKTDPDGLYRFAGLAPNTKYQVCFDTSTANTAALPGSPAPSSLTPTKQNATGDTKDSDIGTNRCVTVTSPPIGENITVDAGFIPPVTLGDFVWYDTNGNGVQDPNEPGIPGATVTLKDANGKVIRTTKTDANGKYGFANLKPDTKYQVCFDVSTANTSGLPGSPAPSGLRPTKQNATGDAKDSDIGSNRCVTVTTPPRGAKLTVDAGFTTISLGDFTWYDANRNGIQDAGESPLPGVTVTLKDSTGKVVRTVKTDANGKYLFVGLKPNTSYQVCFDATTADTSGVAGTPSARTLGPTKQNATGDAKDSDPDLSGCAKVKTPATGARLTVDAGFVPSVAIGDFAWYDANGNGRQDAGEKGIPGVRVTLKNAAGKTLATATTDASGKYRFSGLRASTAYQVCFSAKKAKTSGLPGRPSAKALTPTKRNAAGDTVDSDPAANGCVKITSPAAGENLNIDAGFVIVAIGDFVWYDADANGLQDPGEPGIRGVTVKLKLKGKTVKTTKTNKKGKYLFAGLKPNTVYQVCFSIKTAKTRNLPGRPSPGMLRPTKRNAGHDAADSDMNGCVKVRTPRAGQNLTIDAGFVVKEKGALPEKRPLRGFL